MALSLKHAFNSAIADGGDASLVQPSNWNAEHAITMATAKVLGRATAGTGSVEELATIGTGSVVLATSPSLVTPVLGAATATSVNGLTITSSTGTLTVSNGKVVGISNTLTLAGTDSTTMTFPASSATVAGLSIAQTFSAQNTFAAGSITTSQPLTLTQTWNAGGVTFTGLLVNITDSGSAAASLLMDLQKAGSSQFSINKSGVVGCPGRIWVGNDIGASYQFAVAPSGAATVLIYSADGVSGATLNFTGTYGQFINSSGQLYIVNNGSGFVLRGNNTGTDQWCFGSVGADITEIRRSTSAQMVNIYNTYTDGSNYERGVFDWTTSANVLRLGAENAGTGTLRAVKIVGASLEVPSTFRIDQAASSVGTGTKTISNGADSSTNFGHYFSISLNGTTYYVPCGATAPT